jgi:UDP-glucose 4-epimerase
VIDGVLHLAALMTITMHRDPWTGLDVNMRGTQNLLEAACLGGVRKVVFASSTAVYGYGPGIVGALQEGMPFHAEGAPPAAVLYGASKIVGEQLCRDAKAKRGLDYVVLRYATVYGERQHERAANALALIEAHDRVKAGLRPQVVGDGRETKHFVHVEDVARANADAFVSDATDVALNISGPAPITTAEIAQLIAQAAGREDLGPEFVTPDPSKVRLTSGGPWVMPHAKATRLIGWTPRIGMTEGIARLIAWRDRTPRGGH